MNPELEKELSDAAGEAHWRRVPPLELNEVSLNGDGDVSEIMPGKFERKGGFFRKRLLTVRRNRDQKPEEMPIGTSIKIVFLRKRRKLVERGKEGKILRSTNEHNHAKDAVTLYDSMTERSEAGVAQDLRRKYEGLRTVEIVYALLITENNEPELVRLTVKGASLGSEAKADSTTDLYQYLASFTGGDHIWQFYTELSPVLEQGKKTYFAIDFKRHGRIDDETLADIVAPALRKVRDNCEAVDKSRAEKITQEASTEVAAAEAEREEGVGIDYSKIDINPDDIPF